MSNMSYCRFQNTYPDLLDCYENMDNVTQGPQCEEEEKAKKKIIQLCQEIVDDYGD